MGSWVSDAYNELVNISIYRAGLVGMIAFIIQIVVFAMHGKSYNLDSSLMFLYVVIFGGL